MKTIESDGPLCRFCQRAVAFVLINDLVIEVDGHAIFSGSSIVLERHACAAKANRPDPRHDEGTGARGPFRKFKDESGRTWVETVPESEASSPLPRSMPMPAIATLSRASVSAETRVLDALAVAPDGFLTLTDLRRRAFHGRIEGSALRALLKRLEEGAVAIRLAETGGRFKQIVSLVRPPVSQ